MHTPACRGQPAPPGTGEVAQEDSTSVIGSFDPQPELTAQRLHGRPPPPGSERPTPPVWGSSADHFLLSSPAGVSKSVSKKACTHTNTVLCHCQKLRNVLPVFDRK